MSITQTQVEYPATPCDSNLSANLSGLRQVVGGLVSSVSYLDSAGVDIPVITCIATLGDVGQLDGLSLARSKDPILASGTGLSAEEATIPALVEALERYCASFTDTRSCVLSSRDHLNGPALDLTVLPKCSVAELSHLRCPLRTADPAEPIRWVRGISLSTGQPVWLPAVLVYNRPGYSSSAEKFWIPISTGCAAHDSYERAILNGILEVIERDAISVTWLQCLALPRIDIDCIPPSLSRYWDAYQQSCSDIEYLFFDATTDLCIPTVYGLQIAREDDRATTLVACSTDLEPANAVTKVMRDLASLRLAFRSARAIPNRWEDYRDPLDGATYMARAEQHHAFDFLAKSINRIRLSQMPSFAQGSDRERLTTVLSRLKNHGFETYAVDLTKDEAVRCGIRVVRVLIPGLQPLSFWYRARYLGHPRLYELPRKLGYPVRREDQVNEWPQPFA
jgi:ribosomal protein S12 methylthiotransferase accessory factor